MNGRIMIIALKKASESILRMPGVEQPLRYGLRINTKKVTGHKF